MRRAASFLAFLLAGVAAANPIEHRVQAGDTAYAIARRYGLTVEALLKQNQLSSPDLKVGQVLQVGSLPPAAPPPSAVYTVVAGDTLYGIARRHGVAVQQLITLNALSGEELKIGQTLQIPAATTGGVQIHAAPVLPSLPAPSLPATPPAASAVTSGTALPVRDLALRFLNVPYVLGGNSTAGLDCSGLVLQVFTPLGVPLPRRSEDQFMVGASVERDELREGDLVFFDTEGAGKVSHVGIALDAESFVHANTYEGRVSVNKLNEKYYAERYLGARRVLAAVAAVK